MGILRGSSILLFASFALLWLFYFPQQKDTETTNQEGLRLGGTSQVRMEETFYGARGIGATSIATFSFSWEAPSGITNLTVIAGGGGGGGGGSSATTGGGGGGGGGGGFASTTNVSVTAGSFYTVQVGSGGHGGSGTGSGNNGVDSTFNSTTVVAKGGKGGTVGPNGAGGGTSDASTGTDTFNGGAGGNGVVSVNSGGGGGGAGSASNGSDASAVFGGAGGAGGGGTGVNGSTSTGNAGGTNNNNNFGGGGSGGKCSNTSCASPAGGAGSQGTVRLSYLYDADDSFPIIEGITGGRSTSGNASSYTLLLPLNIEAGDLILVLVASDGSTAVSTTTSGWTKHSQTSNGTASSGSLFYKVATGGETSMNISLGSTEQLSYITFRISNFDLTSSSGAISATSNSSTTTNTDPPSHSCSASGNNLWITIRMSDSTTTASAAPTNYSFWRQVDASGTAGASIDTAVRFLNASSEDPGTWTNSSDEAVSYTLCIPSAVAAAPSAIQRDSVFFID